jgi:hypothetical protein
VDEGVGWRLANSQSGWLARQSGVIGYDPLATASARVPVSLLSHRFVLPRCSTRYIAHLKVAVTFCLGKCIRPTMR